MVDVFIDLCDVVLCLVLSCVFCVFVGWCGCLCVGVVFLFSPCCVFLCLVVCSFIFVGCVCLIGSLYACFQFVVGLLCCVCVFLCLLCCLLCVRLVVLCLF